MENFWMVIREDQTSTTKRHYSLDEAKGEAERLCKKEMKRFYILKTCAYVEPQDTPIMWTGL